MAKGQAGANYLAQRRADTDKPLGDVPRAARALSQRETTHPRSAAVGKVDPSIGAQTLRSTHSPD